MSLLIRNSLNSLCSCAKQRDDKKSFDKDYMNLLISEQAQRIRNLILKCKHTNLHI